MNFAKNFANHIHDLSDPMETFFQFSHFFIDFFLIGGRKPTDRQLKEEKRREKKWEMEAK